MSQGFPANKPLSLTPSQKTDEFLRAVKLSENYWSQDQFEESLAELKNALKMGKVIVEKEPEGALREVLTRKLTELTELGINRSEQLRKGNPKGNNSNREGAGKGETDNESEKMVGAMPEAIVTDKPDVKWEDISGLENVKNALKETLVLPIKFPQLFIGARRPVKGILLYGPPGTGKTLLAKACATDTNATFLSLSLEYLRSKQYVGERQRLIKSFFKQVQEKKPSIFFIDDADDIFGQQEGAITGRVLTEFLIQFQSEMNQGVTVLCAMNRPWQLRPAIRRRLERRIYVPPPDRQARYDMIKKGLQSNKNITEAQLRDLAERTQGFSRSDIALLVKEAELQPVRKLQAARRFRRLPNNKMYPVGEKEQGGDIEQCSGETLGKEEIEMPVIGVENFEAVMERMKPSVDKSQLEQYEKWTQQFGLPELLPKKE